MHEGSALTVDELQMKVMGMQPPDTTVSVKPHAVCSSTSDSVMEQQTQLAAADHHAGSGQCSTSSELVGQALHFKHDNWL